jgi:hypothetical protein
MSRTRDRAVQAVRRELREPVVSGAPASHLADTCAQDRERFVVKAAKSFRLVEDSGQL